MKITDSNEGMEQSSERIPSRAAVSEVTNPRERNPEMEQGIPRTRTPFGVGKLRLGVTSIPGYHLHWIADYPGRLEDAEENGYEFVTRGEVKLSNRTGSDSDSAGERVSRISGSHESGRPLTLHLMKIRNEWYAENQEYYASRTRAIEQQIKTGKIDGVSRPETYHPKGAGISLKTKLE
jgi:hypothetical protein